MPEHQIIQGDCLEVRPVHKQDSRFFYRQHHYAPEKCGIEKYALGLFKDNQMRGTMMLGWGTRPLHTIRRLFPSLGTADYLEICKLCLDDEMPRNSESWFLARSIAWLKTAFPHLSILYTWADGLFGKPGYVYQAANFLYGGYITSEAYFNQEGERSHPRRLITEFGHRDRVFTETLGLTKVWGPQFRYCYFLGSRKHTKELLRESTVPWTRDYPKENEIQCQIQAGEGSRVNCRPPKPCGVVRFDTPAPNLFGEAHSCST